MSPCGGFWHGGHFTLIILHTPAFVLNGRRFFYAGCGVDLIPLFAVAGSLFCEVALRLLILTGVVHGKLNLPAAGDDLAPLNLAAADFYICDAVAHLPQQHTVHSGLLDRGRSGNGGLFCNSRTATGAHGNFTVPCRGNVNRAIALQRQRCGGDRCIQHGIVFCRCHCGGDIFASGRNGHSLSIAGTGKIAIECFHGAVACDAAAGLTGGNRPDDLAGEAAVFTEAVVVHGTAQGHTDTAGLPTDGACRTLLHMAAHHAGKPACKGIAGCDFCGGC